MTVRVSVNGQAREVPAGTTLAQVVAAVTSLEAGIAVAINGEVVPGRSWPATPVSDGDQVEVVTAVQGG